MNPNLPANLKVPGFLAAGIAAGIKKNNQKDFALIFSRGPAAAAGVFTTNRVKAAPVIVSARRTRSGKAQAVLINAGCANACTGREGIADAERVSKLLAKKLGIEPRSVLLGSTGVIGKRLPVSVMEESLPRLIHSLSPAGLGEAAQAIMTTDTFPKAVIKRGQVNGKRITIAGIAKGAGMISPKMATLLSFVITDAAVSLPALRKALQEGVNRSFNCITVDGDMSTNDTLLILANGQAQNGPVLRNTPAYRKFSVLLNEVLALWIADRGGWEARGTIDRFCEFTRFCAREFGAEVDWWCTVNEPEVLGFRGWSEGLWPPRKRDDGAALAVIANLLEAHGRAYRVLHDEDRADADGDGRAAIVGFAKHWVDLVPDRPWFPLDALRTRFEDRVFNRAVIEAPVSGRIALAIPGVRGVSRVVPELEGSLDYIGLNVYTRWRVRALARAAHVATPGVPLSDLGWEIVPALLGQGVRAVAEAGAPILVTEHGFADAKDAFRPRALVESLIHLGRTIERGANVVGYLHWSLLDNFEWSDGYSGRFGLYGVDFDDPARPRRRRRSAELFARIARANGIDAAVAADAGLVL